ncbi:hypothetical protein P9228_18595 [Mesorhizobium sp. WSM4898]|uniref:hypothetical protein n=1 Tax=Mesorhizobium sp. WSM4898 TaxID=3038544 RepID=UPI002415251B|nr:hypothetical protein [Mesorhizobium sp. WSM4898]MDG4908437.1 hypothetical protein [Mesorhizobium sp. WSM4898]
MSEELSEEQLQRMAEKLMAGYRPSSALPGLDAEGRRMAEKLLGRDNTEALQRRGRDGGRFRPKPVTVAYEYWFVDGGSHSMGRWQLARIENGRITNQKACGHNELLADIGRLRLEGQTVREFKIDNRSARPKADGQRKTFVERYGSFKIEGR